MPTTATTIRTPPSTSPADVLHVGHLDTPIGRLTVVGGDRGLRAVLWPGERHDRVPLDETALVAAPHPVVDAAIHQLREYFAGTRHEFDLPLDPIGTPFQRQVWDVLRAIPYGRTISYGEQARRLGDARKARAVGAANGRNPLSIVVPCHRVVGATGALTGFAAGVDVKAWLLHHEQGEAAPSLF